MTDYPPVINEESGGRNRVAAEKGLNAALHWRDAMCGGRAEVNAGLRDADGGLI